MRAIFLIMAALVAAPAYAGTTSSSTAVSSASTTSAASNQGNTQTLEQLTNTPTHQTLYEVPGVAAPAMAASLTGCIGSVTVGAGWAGFGMSGGKTIKDEQCERRNNAEVLQSLGQRELAVQLMCADPEIRKADAGRICK
jgi:hypothetical protein